MHLLENIRIFWAMDLPGMIERLRREKGWSSARLAREAGISRGYLWQLEHGGKDRPSLEILKRLAKALEVGVSQLCDLSESPTPGHELPEGLGEFVEKRGKALGVVDSDVEVLRGIHFRGRRPRRPEDWELLYLFLRQWVK